MCKFETPVFADHLTGVCPSSPMRTTVQDTSDGFACDRNKKKKVTAKQQEAERLFPVDPKTGERVYSFEVTKVNELIEISEAD
jgi:hypothetical protein